MGWGHIMKQDGLENLMLTGYIEGRNGERGQRVKYLVNGWQNGNTFPKLFLS